MTRRLTITAAVLAVLAAACTSGTTTTTAAPSTTAAPTTTLPGGTTTTTPPPTTTTTTLPPTTTTTMPARTVNRIGVRTTGERAEFYDTVTSETFVPRGANYALVVPIDDRNLGPGEYDMVLSTQFYDGEEAGATFADMAARGYNMVRVLVDGCATTGCVTRPAGFVQPPYLDNLADLITRAGDAGLHTWLVSRGLPAAGGYTNSARAGDDDDFAGVNTEMLTRQGIRAHQRYFTDLIEGLVERDVPLEWIFAYTVRHDLRFDPTAPPLSLSSGAVSPAGGREYDMGDEEARRAMLDSGLAFFVAEVAEAIRAVDPDAVVAIGFDRPADELAAATLAAAPQAGADFLDLRVTVDPETPFPAEGYPPPEAAETTVVIGVLAATDAFPDADAAADALVTAQAASCEAGVTGWVLWSWDEQAVPGFWHGLSDGEEIADALAPIGRPDPCQAGR